MTGSLRYDVAVVGAGPAGTTAAYLLARSGVEVCLIDKKVFPRPKLCAGLLTRKTIDLLEQVFGTSVDRLKQDRILHHACRAYRIHYKNTEIVRGEMDDPFHFTQRNRYDVYWLSKALSAGAVLMAPAKVVQVDPETGHLTLSDGRRIRAELIIGADGVASKVRSAIPADRTLRRRWRLNLAASLETYLFHHSNRTGAQYAGLYFGLVPWGYAWSFPGADRQTIGICSLAGRHTKSVKTAFAELADLLHVEMDALRPVRSHPLPYGNYIRQPVYKRVLLSGDAAGLADPLLGEGIYYAHRSAQIAAHAIVDASNGTGEAVTMYSRRLNTAIIKEFKWMNLIRNALFIGGSRRRYRGLKLLFSLMPQRIEHAVQGNRPFSRLFAPY